MIRIGTRGSKLALAQTTMVMERLKEAYPEEEFEIKIISTKGDRIQDRPLNEIGGKGLFVAEIEKELLEGQIGMAVHSMKDMPEEPEEGLTFTKAWKREDSRDALILREEKSLDTLKKGAVIGTGSLRRRQQLLALRPDLKIVDIRGNVDTRLRKMEEQKMDGIVLAAAGLRRLGMENVITCYLPTDVMIPAPAQGVLALEVSAENKELIQMLNELSDDDSDQTARAERIFLKEMGGDCHVAVGASCTKVAEGFKLNAVFEEGKVCVCAKTPELVAKKAAVEIRQKIAGLVTLLGAGPGDPELLTIAGQKAMENADCVVYDRLASPELLALCKPDCEMIYVGKENHHHTMKQEEMNQLLVDLSMKHSHVVRLKGGDVYVFGRGGEEGIVLKENGVPFEVIPGISSALAGLAYAGIPITHRGIARGFHVVTAHDKRDQLADIDFEAMARGTDTCVFLMGLSKLPEIVDGLLKAGMQKSKNIAVISHATTSEQKTCVSTLSQIVDDVSKQGITSPALIVVGDVVSLRSHLNYFEERPLFGKRILVPKIGEGKSEMSTMLEKQGAVVTERMVGKIAYLDGGMDFSQLSQVDCLIFTSKNGIDGFFHSLNQQGFDSRALAGCKIATIGDKTKSRLKKYGIVADWVPEQSNGLALIELLKEKCDSKMTVWYPKGKTARMEKWDEFAKCCQFHTFDVYDNEPTEIEECGSYQDYDFIAFSCGSSGTRILSQMGESVPESCKIISIGPECTKIIHKKAEIPMIEAKTNSYLGMLACMLEQN